MIERIPDVQAITYEGMPHNICDAGARPLRRRRARLPALAVRPAGVLNFATKESPWTRPLPAPLVPGSAAGPDRRRDPADRCLGFPGRHAGRRREGRRRARLGVRECRLLLSRRPRRADGADRGAVRRGGALPRPADGREAQDQGQRAHDRLHADRREGAAQRRRAGQEAQPERGLLPAPRARRRRSRRDRRPPLPRAEPVAGRTCRASASRRSST